MYVRDSQCTCGAVIAGIGVGVKDGDWVLQ